MNRKARVALVAGIVVAVGGGATAAVAYTTGDSETPIKGAALAKASAAALAYTGGGRVTGTEVNDEESFYQVEVTKNDGTQIDVQLDAAFHVLASKSDGETNDGNS